MPSSPAELIAFSRRLRSLRQAFSRAIDLPALSQHEFAHMLGFPGSSYVAYEAGEREPPLSVLVILHRRTGVSLDWLIADERDGSVARSLPVQATRAS